MVDIERKSQLYQKAKLSAKFVRLKIEGKNIFLICFADNIHRD